jgi:tripartite-type tricarboxylate transporter receptor subunit TctC
MEKSPMRRRLLTACFALAASVLAHEAMAQAWPNRTIRIVVPYAPGGGVSVLAQLIGTKLSEQTKQPVVIENRPGAGGNVGADAVAKSAPDGYTILLHTSAQASAGPLYKSLPFDPIKDFAPVTKVIASQLLACSSLKHPATTLRALVADAKARPGSLNYASSGPGSSLHLFAELLKASAGIDLVHIPYRGDAPMITAMIAGDVQFAFLPQGTGLATIQGNQVRALAVTGRKRMAALPNVPTVQEEGIGGLEEGSWNGIWAPAGTPADIVLAIQQAVARTLVDPQVRERMLAVGQEPVGNSPAEFAAEYKADISRFARIIEQAKIPKLD